MTHDVGASVMRSTPRRTLVRPSATGRPLLVWTLYVVGGVAALQMWPMLFVVGDDPTRPWVLPTSIVAMAFEVGLVALPGVLYGKRPALEAYVGGMLGAWPCPVCGYDLRGSAVEDDRCVVCGECGAAWRVSSG